MEMFHCIVIYTNIPKFYYRYLNHQYFTIFDFQYDLSYPYIESIYILTFTFKN